MKSQSAASILLRLIREDEAGWTFDEYEAQHFSGIKVWIASGFSSLKVYVEENGFTGKYWFPPIFDRFRLMRALGRRQRAVSLARKEAVAVEIKRAIYTTGKNAGGSS